MRRRNKLMSWILLLAGGYVAIVALMFVFQEKMIFVGASWGRGAPIQPAPGISVDRLPLPEGRGTFRVARGMPAGEPTALIVWFVGNGEDLRSGIGWAMLWRDHGLASLVVEYPGYGDSDGEPGIDSIHAAADAAAQDAAARAAELGVPLLAGGYSLGAFSAVRVAARGSVSRLLLGAPATTLVDAAKAHYPWLPIGLLLRHRFDSVGPAREVTCPTMIVHGDRDRVISQALGRELAEAFAGPCEFVDAEGYGHVVPFQRGGPFGERIREFVGGR